MEEEQLDYEFEDQENQQPVEGVVLLSDDEEVLILDTSSSLEQQPEWAEAVDREKRALRLLNLKARLGPPVVPAPPALAAAAVPQQPAPRHRPFGARLALAKSGRTAKSMAAKPLTPAQRKEAEQKRKSALWRLRRH